MKYPLRSYLKITGENNNQIAKRFSKLAGKTIGDKTVWNWVNNRYQFRVMVECDDKDLMKIKGVFKEFRIV